MSTITKKCSRCGADMDAAEVTSEDPWVQRMLDAATAAGLADLCDDCGEAEGVRARASNRERVARDAWEDSVPKEYRGTIPSRPDFPGAIYATCKAWARGEWSSGSREPRRLFLGITGPSGLCKTRIAALMAKRLIWDGMRVLWLNSSRFQWACQHQFDDASKAEANTWLRRYRAASWLVFDDIGSLKSSEIVADELYSLLEHRTSLEMPMIWTSNETIEEMLPKLSEKPRARILSRLDGFSNVVTIGKEGQ
jgi:hypothetical protein